MPRRTRPDRPSVPASPGHPSGSRPPGPARRLRRPATRQACRGKACGRRAQAIGARSSLEATARPVPPGHWAQDPVEPHGRLHADLPQATAQSALHAASAVQAATDPDVSSPGSLGDTLHRRATGIGEGSLGILCFGRRLTVRHQVKVHVGHLRWFHHHPADARS